MAAHNVGGMICSDGGVQKPADYVKAIAAHADFVMMGGYLAGYSEAGGQLIFGILKGMVNAIPKILAMLLKIIC